MRYLVSMLVAAVLAAPTAGHAQSGGSVIVQTPRMSTDIAMRIARAALERCREEGLQVGVTVVDRSGQPQVVLRDTLAMNLTLTISEQKAYTAMSFNTPTSELAGRFDGALSVAKVDGILPAAGGVPVTAAGAILGGIGVSGAPSGERDEMCAKAGMDAVRMDLEMSGM